MNSSYFDIFFKCHSWWRQHADPTRYCWVLGRAEKSNHWDKMYVKEHLIELIFVRIEEYFRIWNITAVALLYYALKKNSVTEHDQLEHTSVLSLWAVSQWPSLSADKYVFSLVWLMDHCEPKDRVNCRSLEEWWLLKDHKEPPGDSFVGDYSKCLNIWGNSKGSALLINEIASRWVRLRRHLIWFHESSQF